MDFYNNLSILSWNIRGAFGRNKRRHVRDIVSQYHPSLFLVYETHVQFAKVDKFWHSLGYKLLFIQEARGYCGGIWVLSNRDDVNFSLVDSMHEVITFSIANNQSVWFCSAIYASPVYSVRSGLWSHLIQLRNIIQGPWVLLGDMNEVLNISEVSGGSFSLSRANQLANMMASCDFMDLSIISGLFTWRKNVQNGRHMRKKMDRCMANADWRLCFPHALVEILPPHDSDHNPIFLSYKKAQSTKAKGFHF